MRTARKPRSGPGLGRPAQPKQEIDLDNLADKVSCLIQKNEEERTFYVGLLETACECLAASADFRKGDANFEKVVWILRKAIRRSSYK